MPTATAPNCACVCIINRALLHQAGDVIGDQPMDELVKLGLINCKDSLVTTQNNVQTHVNNTVVDSSRLVQQSSRVSVVAVQYQYHGDLGHDRFHY